MNSPKKLDGKGDSEEAEDPNDSRRGRPAGSDSESPGGTAGTLPVPFHVRVRTFRRSIMSTATWVRDELEHCGVTFEEVHHPEAYTAQALAQR